MKARHSFNIRSAGINYVGKKEDVENTISLSLKTINERKELSKKNELISNNFNVKSVAYSKPKKSKYQKD